MSSNRGLSCTHIIKSQWKRGRNLFSLKSKGTKVPMKRSNQEFRSPLLKTVHNTEGRNEEMHKHMEACPMQMFWKNSR